MKDRDEKANQSHMRLCGIFDQELDGRNSDDEREDEGAREAESSRRKERQSQSERSGGGND